MAATKLLLLFFSVTLLGLSLAQLPEFLQEDSTQSSESEDYVENTLDISPEEEESIESQGKTPLAKPPGGNKKGGRRLGPSGLHGNDAPGGSGPRGNRKGRGGLKSGQSRERPFGSLEKRSPHLGSKKRAPPGGQ